LSKQDEKDKAHESTLSIFRRKGFFSKFSGPTHDEGSGGNISINVSLGNWLGADQQWVCSKMANFWIGGKFKCSSPQDYAENYEKVFVNQEVSGHTYRLLQLPWRIVYTNTTRLDEVYFHKVFPLGERGYYLSGFFPETWLWPTQARVGEIFWEFLDGVKNEKPHLNPEQFNYGNGILATRILQNLPGMLDFYNFHYGDPLTILGPGIAKIINKERAARIFVEEKFDLSLIEKGWAKWDNQTLWSISSTLKLYRGALTCKWCRDPAYLGNVELNRYKNLNLTGKPEVSSICFFCAENWFVYLSGKKKETNKKNRINVCRKKKNKQNPFLLGSKFINFKFSYHKFFFFDYQVHNVEL
jgi:hypothetical protein